MLEVLVAVETAALFIGFPLLFLFVRERVKNLARETTDKALADYKHTQDQTLAQITAGHQRRLHEFGLFAQRRNEVYAETYSLLEKARGGYASHFDSLISTRDFSDSPEADLRNLAKNLRRITEGERESLTNALDMNRRDEAGKIANEIYERDSLRRANDAFGEFRGAWVLHALYFSADVNGILTEGSRVLAHLSVFAHEVIEEGHRARPTPTDRKSRLDYVTQTDEISARLRLAMRAEMQPAPQ